LGSLISLVERGNVTPCGASRAIGDLLSYMTCSEYVFSWV